VTLVVIVLQEGVYGVKNDTPHTQGYSRSLF